MKLKYYLRGLGLGIIVTALVLTIAGGGEESLSDEEIKRRAAELGMVENSSLTLADLQNTAENADKASTEAEASSGDANTSGSESVAESEAAGETKTPESTETSKESQTSGKDDEENTETESAESSSAEGATSSQEKHSTENTVPTQETISPSQNVQSDVVKVTVQAGESSYTVSKQLEELGLIEDALSFDRYLCDIGYSRVIHTGIHKIVPGTSEEEIAKIITGKR